MSKRSQIIPKLDDFEHKKKVRSQRVFSKEPYYIDITIDIPNATTAFTAIGSNNKSFPFAYNITGVLVQNETNNLASIILDINDSKFPQEAYFIDGSNNFTLGAYQIGFLGETDRLIYYPLKIKLKKDWRLIVLGKNTHTSTQWVNFRLLGYRIYPIDQINVGDFEGELIGSNL